MSAMHQGMAMSADGHSAAALAPGWLEVCGVVIFALIALSHLRHMARTDGQRRPWHACHVLMALAMVCMYAPGVSDALPGLVSFGRVTLALAGLLAALWALWGAQGRVNPVWLLTALDLGAMLFMWTPSSSGGALAWVVAIYLSADAVLWALDAVRRLDGHASSLLRWLPVGDLSAGASALSAAAVPDTRGLIGELDISPSMVLMSVGMVYMLVAMHLTG